MERRCRRLAERSADEGVSLNQFAVALLAEGLGRAHSLARIAASPLYGTGSAPALQMVAEDRVEYDQPQRAARKRGPQAPNGMASNHSQRIVQKLSNYCNVLQDDGLSDWLSPSK